MADISQIKLPNGDTFDLVDEKSGYIAVETDPVFSASAAAGITATDISNWNAKVSDTGKWNATSLTYSWNNTSNDTYVPEMTATNSTNAYLNKASATPIGNGISKYDANKYLHSTTPSANDNSTKVATTAYVDAVIPSISLNGSSTTVASFYAPTTVGTSGYVLKSSGSGAPIWAESPTNLSDLTNDMVVSDFPNDAGYSTQTIYASTVLPTSTDGQEGDVWFVYTPSTT